MKPSAKAGLKRTAEMASIFMIGDGLLGVTQPERHVDLWRSSLPGVDALVRSFADRPGTRRIYGMVQIAAGLALAASLLPTFSEGDRDA